MRLSKQTGTDFHSDRRESRDHQLLAFIQDDRVRLIRCACVLLPCVQVYASVIGHACACCPSHSLWLLRFFFFTSGGWTTC